MLIQEVREIQKSFEDQLLPVKIYLFGSYASNNYTDSSDLDFYIVVKDSASDIAAETTKAYKAIRNIKEHLWIYWLVKKAVLKRGKVFLL